MKIDLHSHTTASDGKQSIADLITKAKTAGVEVLAITDHEFIHPEGCGIKDAAKKGITLLHGVELAFEWEGEHNEVLGYGVSRAKLEPFCARMRAQVKKDEANNLKKLHPHYIKLGFTLSPLPKLLEELKNAENLRAGNILYNDIYANPANVAPIKKYNMVQSSGVYNLYLHNKKSPLYFKTTHIRPSIEEVVQVLRESGALVFMAHPLHSRHVKKWARALLNYAVDNKLVDGLEVWHPKQTKKEIKYLYELAKKHNLLMSGGSDNHYKEKPLGVLSDGSEVTDAEMPWLKRLIKATSDKSAREIKE